MLDLHQTIQTSEWIMSSVALFKKAGIWEVSGTQTGLDLLSGTLSR